MVGSETPLGPRASAKDAASETPGGRGMGTVIVQSGAGSGQRRGVLVSSPRRHTTASESAVVHACRTDPQVGAPHLLVNRDLTHGDEPTSDGVMTQPAGDGRLVMAGTPDVN